MPSNGDCTLRWRMTESFLTASAINLDIQAFVNGIEGIDLKILDPGLEDEVIRFMPHEYPRCVLYDAVLGLAVEVITPPFIHGTLRCFDQTVEFWVKAAR